MSKPTDYHDYIFKDGKLIGDFENMYRYSDITPWKQDKASDEWFTKIGMVMLEDKAPYESILEIGCGLGYISSQLTKQSTEVDAFDISAEAIKQAKALHKGINFFVKDITKSDFKTAKQYDLVVIKDLFWYIFDNLAQVFLNIQKCTGKYLYVHQSFPRLDHDFVGKSAISGPEQLQNILSQNYNPIYIMTTQRYEYLSEGPAFYYLGAVK